MSNPTARIMQVGDGFHLTRIRSSDKAAYLEHLADEEIARNTMAIPFPYMESDADWWLNRCEQAARDPEVRFGIREPDGYLVGAIGVVGDLPAGAKEAEFGYWLARAHRGHGLIPRVIEVFASHMSECLGVYRLYATPFLSNMASHRVLEKAGFVRGDILRQHYFKDGVQRDAVMFTRVLPPGLSG